jgi:hypothetical protein
MPRKSRHSVAHPKARKKKKRVGRRSGRGATVCVPGACVSGGTSTLANAMIATMVVVGGTVLTRALT